MRSLVTGSNGLVGGALTETLTGRLTSVTALPHGALDVTQRQEVLDAIAHHRPDVIFNCAVVGVDECESDPALARHVNVDGPCNVAEAAERVGATMVHFSSNYVFDGHRPGRDPYTIDDDPLPINEYGRTKLEGERAVRRISRRAIVVRTSWVFGKRKESFLSIAAARLMRGETIRAITDTFASTTYVEDLVPRLLSIIDSGVPGLYQIVNEGTCSYETFALEAARLTGSPAALIERVRERELERLAVRPAFTPMRCLASERLGLPPLRPWTEALAAFIGSAQQP